jgi:hypothetical protein
MEDFSPFHLIEYSPFDPMTMANPSSFAADLDFSGIIHDNDYQ